MKRRSAQGPGAIRRAAGAADTTTVLVSALVVTASWAGVGYAIGGWVGTVVGAVLGLAASVALGLLIGRLRV